MLAQYKIDLTAELTEAITRQFDDRLTKMSNALRVAEQREQMYRARQSGR